MGGFSPWRTVNVILSDGSLQKNHGNGPSKNLPIFPSLIFARSPSWPWGSWHRWSWHWAWQWSILQHGMPYTCYSQTLGCEKYGFFGLNILATNASMGFLGMVSVVSLGSTTRVSARETARETARVNGGFLRVPSGKHTKNSGKSTHFSWENPLFLWSFSSSQTVNVYQRVNTKSH